MKTDELVQVLASSGAQVDAAHARLRFWAPLGVAVLFCVAAVLLTVGARGDWREAMALPMFWFKLAFPALVAAAAMGWLRSMGHPGARWAPSAVAAAVPFGLLWLVAAVILASAPAPERAQLVLGSSSVRCVLSIAVLSVPAGALTFAAVRSLAPTRLALSGFAAGLAAGAIGAFAYALHCDEMQAPFLAVWYVLGMLVPAAIGAWAGPKVLRW